MSLLSSTEAGEGVRGGDGIQGLEVIDTPLPWYSEHRNLVLAQPRDVGEGQMRVVLSRERYWAEDGHLDVVVEFGGAGDWEGSLLVVTLGVDGEAEGERFEFRPPGGAIGFNPPLPQRLLAKGGEGWIALEWLRQDREPVEERRAFRVENVRHGVADSGSIAIELPNRLGVSAAGVPLTVGVPFPRGVLWDVDHLRLVDAGGRETAIQVRETARWSRFGSVKWVLLDFVHDFNGTSTLLALQYGEGVRHTPRQKIKVDSSAAGFPLVDAGTLKWDGGLHFIDPVSGVQTGVLAAAAGAGGYVERVDGTVYRMSGEAQWTIEEHGPVKVVLARRGWFHAVGDDGEGFNQYITRWTIYRDSPLMRLFHTWIYTGDSDRGEDRIQAMGWEFPAARGQAMQSPAFLLDDRQWVDGERLLQFDHSAFELTGGDEAVLTGERFGGVTRSRVGDVAFTVGGVDFWQNFPAEIDWSSQRLEWNLWPRNNRPAQTEFGSGDDDDRDWILPFLQARFAHEGDVLDFKVPQFEQLNAEIRRGGGGTGGFGQHPNAQGISHTSELWLYFAGTDAAADAGRLLEAIDSREMEAVVDPWWVAQTGALYEMHPQDWQRFPELEEVYAEVFRAPSRWAERLGIYGKWVYGDVPAWVLNLEPRQPVLYRAYRKAHHAWPLPWEGYARSGDPELRKILEASTRQMIDVNFSHFHDGEIIGGGIGVWNVGPLPWAADTEAPVLFSIHNKVDYMWLAYYLTGYQRARENALLWAAAAKATAADMPSLGGGVGFRTPTNLMKTYLETYEATFDPWFLVAAHSVGAGHQHLHQRSGFDGAGFYGHYSADREFHRYTGSTAHKNYYRDYADGRPLRSIVSLEANAYAWQLFQEPVYLQNVARILDPTGLNVYLEEEPGYMTGTFMTGSTGTGIATSFFLRNAPAALHALAQVEDFPQPTLLEFNVQAPAEVLIQPAADQPVTVTVRSVPPGVARPWGDGELQVAIKDETGEQIFAGRFEVQTQEAGQTLPGLNVELPVTAAERIYSLSVEPAPSAHWTRSLVLPVAADDVREVLVAKPGAPLRLGQGASLWFLVPEEVESFDVHYRISIGQPQMISVWNPDGRRVARGEFLPVSQPATHSYTIDVPQEYRNRLWRVVLPVGGSLLFDEHIPHVFSLTPAKVRTTPSLGAAASAAEVGTTQSVR